MSGAGTRLPPAGSRLAEPRSRDVAAGLVAPVAVRIIDLEAPLPDLSLWRESAGQPYRSLLALVRFEGAPLGVVTFPVDPGGRVSRARVARGLRQLFGAELLGRSRVTPVGREARNRTGASLSSRSRRLRLVDPVEAAPASHSVSVIVPTCDNPQALEECLRAILESDYGDFEVIVVENRPEASESASMLARQFPGDPRLRYVEEPRKGASRARDAGLAQATGEIVAFTDDDVIVDRAWIRASVDALVSADDVACVTGLILPLELESDTQLLLEQFAGFGKGFRRCAYRLPDARDRDPLFPYTAGAIGSGASIALRAQVAREVGGFDPALGPATPATGGEDLDLFIRLLRAGHAVAYEPRAIVWHRHPDGMPRLRRQVYRYGVGLGAMLGKQLITGPRRRELVRAVPAGIRYARDPASRKNAGKPTSYPRHLTWLEWLGMLVGPVAYLLSALLQQPRRLLAPRKRISRPTPVDRLVVLSTGETMSVVWFREPEVSPLRLLGRGRLRLAETRRRRRWRRLRSLERRSPRARDALHHPRSAILAATATCVACPLLVAFGAPLAARMSAVLAFMCFAPGTAFLTAVRARLEPGLVVAVSTAIAVLLAQSMLWLGAWWPRAVLYSAAGICMVPLLWRLMAGSPRRADGARVSIGRMTWFHTTMLAGALLAWASSLLGADLSRMGGIGLLSAMPFTYYLAFAPLLVGFAFAATRKDVKPALLGAYVLALIVVLHATTAVLYHEPRYAWTYKHLGVINLIASTGSANRQIDVYNNWPAFFAANAWLSRTSGVAPIAYAGWAQLFFNLWAAFAVRFALRGLTRDERLLWTATLMFVLGNWVGQDYLAPQAFGFVLSLVVLGLSLRCGSSAMKARRRRGRSLFTRPSRRAVSSPGQLRLFSSFAAIRAMVPPRTADDEPAPPPLGAKAALVAGGLCFLAVVTSHQLSPVLLIASVAFLAAFTRRVPLAVPAVMLAIEAWWLALAWPFVSTHFNLIDPGTAGAAAPDRNLVAALPGAALSFYAPAALMILVSALAAVGAARRLRAGKRDLAPACFIVAPMIAVALQSYGGEGGYRAYLFALPWLAFLAGQACTRPSSPVRVARTPRQRMHRPPRGARISLPRLVLAGSVVCACLLFAYFGQELVNRIPAVDVQAAVWYEQHAPPGSIRIDLAPSSPERLTARYPLVSLSDPASLLEQPGFAGHMLGAPDLPRLVHLIQAQGAHPAYVVLSRAQEDYARLNGLLPGGSVGGLARAMAASKSFRLVYRRPGVWIFQYTGGGVGTIRAADRQLTR